MPRTSWEKLSEYRLQAPSLRVQSAIADYLDTETVRIDALVEKKRRMVELLNARFAAWREQTMIATEHLTWTPLHHLTDASRPIVYGIVQAGDEVPDGVPYIKTGDLPELQPDLLSRTSAEIDEQYRRARVHPGDIVIAMRASIGLAAVVPTDLPTANLTQGTARVAPSVGVDARWLFQVLHCRVVQQQCEVRAVGTTFKTLNIWDLRRIMIPTPSLDRQHLIAERVESQAAWLAQTGGALARQTDLLIEHRQALITAAVTGELAIPGVAA
jgi:type I restriction enzyme S subunit